MKNITIVLVSFLFLLISSESAAACWCRREVLDTDKKFRAEITKELDESFIVLSGEAVERNKSGLRFRVEKVWKGDVKDEVIFDSPLYVDRSSSDEETFIDDCAFLFEVGKKYLVYATRDGNKLYVNKCRRTQLLEGAERDIRS